MLLAYDSSAPSTYAYEKLFRFNVALHVQHSRTTRQPCIVH